jgi:hypothetical protein
LTLQCLFGYPVLSLLFKCCSHFCWYQCISRTMFCTPSLSLMDWFLSQCNLIIHNGCLKTLIGDASRFCSCPQHPGFTTEF